MEALRDTGPAMDTAEGAPRQGLDDLPALADRFAAAGRARVGLHVADDVTEGVPAEVGSTAYRLVTEALTNVRRHAPGATRVEVAVVRAEVGDAPALAVTVRNDGVRTARPAPDGLVGRARSGGFGLAGQRERVEALGGTPHAGPDESDGWRLRAVLPVRGRAAW